jgi:phosphoribosylformylglycinamidine synthase
VLRTFAKAGVAAERDRVAAKASNEVIFRTTENRLCTRTRSALQKIWSETSFYIQSLRDNPECAAQEFALLDDARRPGLFVDVPFDLGERVSAPFVHVATPRVAILREQGVNGQVEMAAAFDRAGFALSMYTYERSAGGSSRL